ncbi:MAG: TipC family immunity protein, partial [Streptococcus sp.]|nr:TipC family immunity protein [Streptococcus sp.]
MRIKKMQKLKKWLIFSMSLVALCLGYFAVRHYIIHNIFDEIYYNQQNSLGTSALEKIEGV